MFRGRFIEFFESEQRLAMSNLSAFFSTITVNGLAVASMWVAPTLTPDLIYASVTLGGFTIAANKLGNVWQNIRVKQAEQGIQPAPIVPPASPITQNIGVKDA